MKKIICTLALVAVSTPAFAGAWGKGDPVKAAERAGACEVTGIERAGWRDDGKLNVWCNDAAVLPASGAAAPATAVVPATNFVPLAGVLLGGLGAAAALGGGSSTSDTQ